MSDDQDDDKQHEPSQKKLDDARKKGEVPRSNDLTTAASYAGFLLAAMALGVPALSGFAQGLSGFLIRPVTLADLVFAGSGTSIGAGIASEMTWRLAPFFLFPAALALMCVIAQRSFTVTLSKLQPKLSRISVLGNAKNKFGRGGLFVNIRRGPSG
ncbi:EscU/YscU/HrcU family type III secretion system export apparatus switch protein [Oceaniglobus indicus]|uniref:EscU/YscU/HrcU family type III secretion system export apparatus switch protein n=1 Tax=Oceaniglobus indicus TaxID=2047749 RepID=UPI0013043CB7|nr:EscU/YscU/HrcU family type III secretion system export apparatus switch protein [Oceaniglobus indicus]